MGYTAYTLAMEQRVKYVGDILQALLIARKKKWDENEVARMERESETFKYVKGLVEKERKELLEEAGEDEEKIDDVNFIQVRRCEYIPDVMHLVTHIAYLNQPFP
jgi:STIP1 family protein 1